MKRTVKVTAKPLIAKEGLHPSDQEEFDLITGEHIFETCTEDPKEEALTYFHHSIPIKVLEDFEITAEFIPSGKNENCLADMVCPECGHERYFSITAVNAVTVYDDGVQESEADYWDEASSCFCPACAHRGTVAHFTNSDWWRVKDEQ